MLSHGMGANYSLLESYYVQRVLELVQSMGKSPIAYQEVFDNGLNLTNDTVVDAWKNPFSNGQAELARITKGGLKAILSAGWYIVRATFGASVSAAAGVALFAAE